MTPTAIGVEPVINAFTVDVEDYFQVLAFEKLASRSNWENYECRVERNTDLILGLLEERRICGTFFILGWVAERYPELVRRIVAAGHEIASHGCLHERVTEMSKDAFRHDVMRSKLLLEDIGGRQVMGYRAPSFSISTANLWAWDVLADVGYRYSSSVFPGRHDIYGIPGAPRFPFVDRASGLTEVPITTIEVAGTRLSCGGGGFFRLWPYPLFREALRYVNRREAQPAVFYLHPWEVDPAQPRMRRAPLRSRFRHYLNLSAVVPRLGRLLEDFSWGPMDQVFGFRSARSVGSDTVAVDARGDRRAVRREEICNQMVTGLA